MLRVTNVQEDSQRPCIVEINSYVPISFRSQNQPIGGARYIRLGDFKTRLLELQLPSESLVVSGFTLVSVEGSLQDALVGQGPSIVGLPAISMPQGQDFSGRIPRLDIQTEIALFCGDGQVEVRLGAAEIFNRRVVHRRVQFLLLDDVLVGLRVVDLSEVEQQTLRGYVAQHPSQVY